MAFLFKLRNKKSGGHSPHLLGIVNPFTILSASIVAILALLGGEATQKRAWLMKLLVDGLKCDKEKSELS